MRDLPKFDHGDYVPVQSSQNRERGAANLRVRLDTDANRAAGASGMNIADAPVGKLRSQLAVMHESEDRVSQCLSLNAANISKACQQVLRAHGQL